MKVAALATAAFVALLIAGMLIAGGEHGPGRHLGAAVTASATSTTTSA